jgi:hypothetical protein
MKHFVLAGVLALALPVAAWAAEIHGTVSEGGKPIPAGAALKLECGQATATGKTDEFGSYSLKVGGTGECRLSLDYKGASPSITVTVYDRPSRYDLVVTDENGKPALRRK